MHTINWYPGHMAKARRMLEDNLKLVDMIIEIVVLLFLIKVTFHQRLRIAHG